MVKVNKKCLDPHRYNCKYTGKKMVSGYPNNWSDNSVYENPENPQYNDNLNFNYNFAIDNDFKTFEYNEFNATLNINNFITKFNFIEENGEMGDSNIIENSFGYSVDNNNSLSFKTRRNRKLNLTEYYDLVYEYKNDCLIAGIKYKKTYYQDRDLKPTEDLMLSFTFYPLTTYEQEIDQSLYRN